jgi:hypothetical protein
MTEPFNWRDHLKVHPAADLFPLMSPDELKALADDIKANGLQTPIVLWKELWPDDTPILIDGRNRLDALALLGWLEPPRERSPREAIQKHQRHIKDHPVTINEEAAGRPFQDHIAGDPYDVALSLNVHRRHLNAEQKRDLIAKVLKAKPEQSDRQIAGLVKTDHKTVGTVRSELESTGEIPPVEGRPRQQDSQTA